MVTSSLTKPSPLDRHHFEALAGAVWGNITQAGLQNKPVGLTGAAGEGFQSETSQGLWCSCAHPSAHCLGIRTLCALPLKLLPSSWSPKSLKRGDSGSAGLMILKVSSNLGDPDFESLSVFSQMQRYITAPQFPVQPEEQGSMHPVGISSTQGMSRSWLMLSKTRYPGSPEGKDNLSSTAKEL